MTSAFLLFLGVFVLNLIPAFAPPTWMALAVLALNHPELDIVSVALISAVAATGGRCILAMFALRIVRNRWLSDSVRENIDVLREMLERKKSAVYGLMVFYLYCPASNYLFIAHGLTAIRLRIIAIPFFIGRCLSYSAWMYAAKTAAKQFNVQELWSGGYLGGYYVAMQCLLLFSVWLFTRIDWQYLFTNRRLRLLQKKIVREDVASEPDA